MNIKLWSDYKYGKWAAGLTLLFILLMYLKFFAYRIPLPSPVIAVFGVTGMAMGITSFIKNNDRSILTYVSMVIGLLILIWVTAEIMYPH